MCLKPLPYLQMNNLHYCENGQFSPRSLSPSPPPPISMLEKLFTWKVKRYQHFCTQGLGGNVLVFLWYLWSNWSTFLWPRLQVILNKHNIIFGKFLELLLNRNVTSLRKQFRWQSKNHSEVTIWVYLFRLLIKGLYLQSIMKNV